MPSTIDYHRRPRSRAASSKHGPGGYYDGPSAARLPSVTRKRSTSNPEDLHAKQPMSSTAALPRVSTMQQPPMPQQQQQQQPSPMFSRSTFEGARTYPAPSSSRYFLTVIPPLELPLDPPHPRSTAASAGSSSHVRRGTLVPLYPTLGGQLYAIAREYGLPSIGGLAIYLCDDGEGNLGPRIGDSAWSALWARHFDDEWAASPDLAMMTHEREASSASSSGDWRPATTTTTNTRASQAATATTSNRASPMPYANGGGVTPSPRYSRAHQSHSHSQAHPYSNSQPQSRMGAATATPSSSLLFGSRLPIVGRVEWTVDRNRAPWWNAWVAEAEASGTTSTPSSAAAHTPSAAAAAAAMADRSGTSMASGFGGAYMPASGFSSAGGLAKRSRSHRRRSLHLRGGSAMSRHTRSRSDDDGDDDEDDEEEGEEDGGDEMTSGSPLARRAEPSDAYSRSESHPSPVQTMTRSSYGTGSPLEPVRALDRGFVAAPAPVAHAGPAEPERGDQIGDEDEGEGEGENVDDDEGEIGDDSNEQIGASSSVDEDADEEQKDGAAAAAAGYMALDDEATADTQLTSLDGGLLPSSHQQQQQQQQHGLLDVSRPTTMAHSADADGGSTAGFGSYNGYSALLDVDDEKETTSRGGAASHRSLVADGDAGHLPSFEMMPESDEGMWMDLQRHSGSGGQHQLRLSAQSLSDHARTPRGREAGPHSHPHQPLSVAAALPRSSSVEEWITKTGRHSGLQGGDAVDGNDEDDDDEDGLLPPQDDVGEVMGLWAQSDAVFPPQHRLSRDMLRDTQASARNSGEKQLGAASGSRPHSTSRSPSPNAPLVPPPNEALPALPQPRSHAALAAGATTAASASLLSPIALDSSPSAFSGPSANLVGLTMATMASKRRHLVGEEDDQEEEEEQQEEEEEEGGLDERDMSSSSVDSNAIIGLGTTLPPSSHTHSHPQSSPRLELPSASGDEQSRRSSMTEQSDTLLDMERAVALLSPGQSPALLQHDVATTPTPSTVAAPAAAAAATSFSSSRDSFAKAKSLSTSVTPSPRWLKASSASALSVMPRSASALVAASASAAAVPRPPLHRGGSQTPPARLTEEGAQGEPPSLGKSSSSPRPASSPAATSGGGLQTKKRIVSQESRDGARDEQEQEQVPEQGEAYPVLNRQSPSAASDGSRYDEDDERRDVASEGQPSRAAESEDEDEEGGEKMWRNNSHLQLLGTQGWSETTGDQSRSLNTPMDEAGEMPPWRQPTPVTTAEPVAADHESTPTQVQGAFENYRNEDAATALPSTPLYHEASVGPEYVTVGVQADQSPLGDDEGDYDDDDDDDDGDGDGGRERGNGSDDGHAYQHGRDDSLFSLVSMGAASETMDHSESAPDIDGAKPLQTPVRALVPAQAQAQAEVDSQTEAEAEAEAEAEIKAEAQSKAQSKAQAEAEAPGLQEYHRRVMPHEEDHLEQRPSIERLIRGNSFAESCESSASSSKGPSPAMAHFEFPKRTKVGSPQQLQQQLQLTPAAIMHTTPRGDRRDDDDDSDDDDVWSQEGSHDDGAPRAFSEVEGARTPTFLYDQHLGEAGRAAAHDGHSSYISSSSTIGRNATGGMDDLDRRVDQMLSSVGSRYPDDVPLPSSSLPMSLAAATSASAPATTAYAPFLEQMNLQRQQQQQQRYDDVPPLAAALVSPPFAASANGKMASNGRRPSSLSSSAAAEAGAARRASASSLASGVPLRTKASSPSRPIHFDPPPAVLARSGGGGGPASPAKTKPVVSPLVLANQSPRQRFGALPPSPRQFPPHIFSQHSPTFPPPPPLAASTNGFGAGSPYQSPTLSPSMGPYLPAQRTQTTQPQHTP